MHDVDTALDLLCGRDLASGRRVSEAWHGLSGGDTGYRASQFDVQRYLWLILPRMVRAGDPPDGRPVAAAFAEFFDLTGEPRYAAICRGRWTERVLAAAGDRERCAELAINAMDDSGVLPPEELDIAWLPEPGPYEAAAFDAIARALETAIAEGQIPLATPATDTLRLVLALDLLGSRIADDGARTVVQAMVAERMRYWSRQTPSQALREQLVRTEPDVATPPRTELDTAPALAPLRLLLESCAGPGAKLTRAGYLPTDLVASLVEAMPCARTFPGSGRSESHWPPVGQLRDLAYRCELVDHEDGRLRLTHVGEDALADDRTLFEALATTFIGYADPPHRQHVLETVLTMLLLENRVDRAAIDRRLGVVLAEYAVDPPPSREDVLRLRVEALWDLRVVGALLTDDVERPVGLNEVGRELAVAALRARVLQGWWWG
ncbi:hypothetical protein [Actinophytocola gossypii]|uniref:Uncharacterized protein n=1 Tax=Actinophytocola gossypii TaxID=2812003 RepID=A0ABT2JED7_9PSEU|nr:hypothetical protein [Actinophytocola gossypii]MCT2585639.1 hypothetical protein [Actinophytocola gossypii]